MLVVGLGVSGAAVARHLLSEGFDVMAADDGGGLDAESTAATLGIELVLAPDVEAWSAMCAAVDEVVVSPGVPAGHRLFSIGSAVPIIGEVELAWRRSVGPMVAVTGTNGKTTVTTLVAEMLEASGIRAMAAGNIGKALIDAVDGTFVTTGVSARHGSESSDGSSIETQLGGREDEPPPYLLVAEVSSFQLALTEKFHPTVATWINFSEDHLDWHPDMEHYRSAKARIWANAGPGDVVVANAEDQVVMAAAAAPRSKGARVETFGITRGDWSVANGVLTAPGGGPIVPIKDLPRSLPHDQANALAASATAVAAGASLAACRSVLENFRGLPHRVELVSEARGVRWYDDSKATTPGAVLAALRGFDSVVLIAGGRNKGLDLGVLREGGSRLRKVIAIGDAAVEVESAFQGLVPVSVAASMSNAVAQAADAAEPGDAVLLSPGCASFDWYSSYSARGDAFARCVHDLLLAEGEL